MRRSRCKARRGKAAGPLPAAKSNTALVPGTTYDTSHSDLTMQLNEIIPEMPLYVISLAL